MKMSVYERTDVDDERAGKDTGVERSDRRRGDRGGCGGADGGERAPCVATAGSVQRGGSSCHSSREQGQEAVDDHGHGYTTEGQGVGRSSLRRPQPHPSDRDAVGARGDRSVTLDGEEDPAGRRRAESAASQSAPGATAVGSATSRRGCCCRSTAADTTGSSGEAPI